jgi:hypothetical protein
MVITPLPCFVYITWGAWLSSIMRNLMADLPLHLLQRTFASRALDVVKMKGLVPCDVENRLNGYTCRIVEVVFDPLKIEEVNGRFKAAGYPVEDEMQVIAVNADGSILMWGGFNSVYYVRKGEPIKGAFDNLAFDDILDLTQRFKIKNKKVEIDALITQLKRKSGGEKSGG